LARPVGSYTSQPDLTAATLFPIRPDIFVQLFSDRGI
jgi:hypothetical protein